ncbi:MAG TPA: cupin domain-containing protein [Gemmataceae bacterium]|nr:cupin domain-containing protein [Gemmataceae bacterium]
MPFRLSALAALGALGLTAATHGEPPAAPHEGPAGMEVVLADKVQWRPGPPSLPKGALVALLEGDPAKEGPFVFRVKLPDGYRIAPHTHPKVERVTVLSGTLYIGMGARFDEKAGRAMPAGAYGHWPAGMRHFAWAKGETVIQLHGVGPWSIQYVNAIDDPRKRKE